MKRLPLSCVGSTTRQANSPGGGGGVSELEEKLNTILSDPEAMAQIASLAQSLGAASGTDAAAPSDAPGPPPREDAGGDLSALLSKTVASLDPALLRRLLPVLAQLNREQSSQSAALVYTLRPFLRASRRDKVERAVQLARLIHLAKEFLITREE